MITKQNNILKDITRCDKCSKAIESIDLSGGSTLCDDCSPKKEASEQEPSLKSVSESLVIKHVMFPGPSLQRK
jgi:hypothetical protein